MGDLPGFVPGSLMRSIEVVSARALATGALRPIATSHVFVEQRGVRFFVRVLASLARKDEARWRQEQQAAAGRPANPFLPYERELYVADVSGTHVAILNKFNVVERHLLVVTRAFEDQRSLLTLRDFEALRSCMDEFPGLGFYNGGVEAGASQQHKHLQLVPLPLAPEGPAVPIEPLLPAGAAAGEPAAVPGFDFRHAFARLRPARRGDAGSAREAYACYGALLERAGLQPPAGGGTGLQSGPYCLLVTDGWMLLVPRSREFFGQISVNSLGFAGALLVRNEEQLRALAETGPFTALRETALPA
jgi:ATP adenylyltransferase